MKDGTKEFLAGVGAGLIIYPLIAIALALGYC